MIKLLKHIRKALINQNRMNKYLFYAFGEIVLVVIGILIALQINNWNQQRLAQEELLNVYERIVVNIENDIADFKQIVKMNDSIEPVFKKVMEDSITPDLFDLGLSRITTNGANSTLNLTGINQLKQLNVKDSLSMNTIELYDYINTSVKLQEQNINDEIGEVVKLFIKKSWYPEWMSKTIMQNNSSKELQNYFLYDSNYRNLVIYQYQLRYVNYRDNLKRCIDGLTAVKDEINKMLKEQKN